MNFLLAAVIGLAGVGAGFFASKMRVDNSKNLAKDKARGILAKASREAKELTSEQEEKRQTMRRRLHDQEIQVEGRLETIGKRLELLKKQEQKWDQRLGGLEQERKRIAEAIDQDTKQTRQCLTEQVENLVNKTGLDRKQVLADLESKYLAEFQRDYDKYLQKAEYFASEESVKTAKQILISTMNRYSAPSSVMKMDNTITVKENKAIGRIIGKEGRNINYFEKKTQVSVIFNDHNPNEITVSTFHLLRRELARLALKRLVTKKAINEEVIDAAIASAQKELDKELEKLGKWAADIIELPKDKYDPELLRLIGRLKYRTSYGQNILYHSLEIGFFCAMMAAEIGADVEVAKLAGFFHDVGKAIDQDDGVDKPHDHLSKDILEQFNFDWEVVHAAWVHHDAEPSETIEAELVKAADAISAGRPGARAESSEEYYARMAALEEMAMDQKAADKVLVMSAGREVRLFVKPDKITDEEMPAVASELAHNIEENLAYPGKIKINLVRQMKAVDYAKEGHG